MQDDFGDFLQAAPGGRSAAGVGTGQRAVRPQNHPRKEKDLSTKIMESFDLSQSSQKSAQRFRTSRKTLVVQSVPGSNPTNYSYPDVNTGNYATPPAAHHPPQQHNYAMPQNVYGGVPTGYPTAGVWQAHGNQVQNPPRGMMAPPNQHQFMTPQTYHATALSSGAPNAVRPQGIHVRPNSSHYQQPMHSAAADQNARASRSRRDAPGNVSLPSWMTLPSKIPPLYKDVLKKCATPSNFADTSRLYPILVSSNLPKDVLRHIWSVANQSTPGQLTFSEVYIALALVALAQRGDMNFTMEYVASLRDPPIPNVQLMAGPSKPEKTSVASATAPLDNRSPPQDDGYTGFHSVPVPPPSTATSGTVLQPLKDNSSVGAHHTEAQPGHEFDDFQDFQSSDIGTSNTTSSSLPTLLPVSIPIQKQSRLEPVLSNSPRTGSSVDFPTKGDALVVKSHGEVTQSFNTFSSTAHNSQLHAASFTKMADTDDDDFTDFKMNTSTGQPNASPYVSDPVSAKTTLPNVDAANILEAESAGYDRYSALRGLTSEPPSVGGVLMDAGEAESSDLWSALSPQQPSIDLLDVDNAPITATPNIGLDLVLPSKAADAGSVNSLELPSLSDNISKLSIGNLSTSASGMLEMNPISQVNPEATPAMLDSNLSMSNDLYTSNISWQNNMKPFPASTSLDTNVDDGLYDLDDPLSPPSVTSEKVINQTGVQKFSYSPPKRPVARRTVSEASSDFGDFSSAPPPIDSVADDDDGLDAVHGAYSSLTDFDAFGHSQETKSKKEPAGKPKKKESTAFSEFIKHELEKKSLDHSLPVAEPVEKSVEKGEENEDWGDFETEVESTVVDSVTSSPSDSTEKDLGSDTRSEFDIEASELKSRMDGNTTSDPAELCIEHWGRCLATCKDIIVSTGEIFAALNSPSVCLEIVNSTRGKEFISCTSEVYGVASRIRKSMGTVGLQATELDQTLKDIEIAWNNVLGFCPCTPSVHGTPEYGGKPVNGTDQSLSENAICSLCLLSTVEDALYGAVEYGGRAYHAPCANLWLNQVAPMLPTLEIPHCA